MTPEFKAKFIALAIAAIVAAVQLGVEHAIPWEKLFKRQIGPPWTYIAGVASLGVPFSVLMILWRDWWGFWAFWILFIAGGLPVFLGYDIRMRLENESLRADLNEVLKMVSDWIRQKGGGNGQASR